MRIILKAFMLTLLLGAVWIHGETLWGNRLFLNEPRIHVIQKGEYLSEIAKRYYGNGNYWRALALINRAPNPDRVYPGEQIILPDAGAVARIARARRLSEVNEIVSLQEQQAVLEDPTMARAFVSAQQPTEPPKPVKKTVSAASENGGQREAMALNADEEAAPQVAEPLPVVDPAFEAEVVGESPPTTEKASGGWLWPVVLVSALLIGGIVLLVRRRRANALEDLPDEEPVWSGMERSGRSSKESSATNEIAPVVRRRETSVAD